MATLQSQRSSVKKRVLFGKIEECGYSATRSDDEKRASWYSTQQYEEMKIHAYGIAKTAVLLGEFERTVNGNSLRGLEKMIPNKTTNSKRRRNVIRSIVELYQMEINLHPTTEKTASIKVTLEKYVKKHIENAQKVARDRALEDEREALKVHFVSCNQCAKDVPVFRSKHSCTYYNSRGAYYNSYPPAFVA